MNLFSGADIYHLVFVTLPREGPYTYREGLYKEYTGVLPGPQAGTVRNRQGSVRARVSTVISKI